MNGIKMIKDGKKLMIGYFDEKNYLDGMCIKLKMNE